MSGNGKFLSIGWRYILPVWGGTLFVLVFSDALLLNLLLITMSFFTAYIFYVPERAPVESVQRAIISPIDGKVLSVSERGDGVSIVIKKSLFDGSSVVRAPMACKLDEQKVIHGLFLKESHHLSASLNENAKITWFIGNREYLLKIKCGFYSLSLPLLFTGGKLEAGENLALLTDGSAELLLPKSSTVEIKPGERVVGGYSLLAYGAE
ncbi:MAG: hypothetical protein L3J42_02650 [Hydrogenimonas sp.]|nr:hypothetical protein [Hydrogenimonas sp.]